MKIIGAKIVSDGIVITFTDRSICYFPAEALLFHRGALGTQAFLDYDPSPTEVELGVADFEDGRCSQDGVQSVGRREHRASQAQPSQRVGIR